MRRLASCLFPLASCLFLRCALAPPPAVTGRWHTSTYLCSCTPAHKHPHTHLTGFLQRIVPPCRHPLRRKQHVRLPTRRCTSGRGGSSGVGRGGLGREWGGSARGRPNPSCPALPPLFRGAGMSSAGCRHGRSQAATAGHVHVTTAACTCRSCNSQRCLICSLKPRSKGARAAMQQRPERCVCAS